METTTLLKQKNKKNTVKKKSITKRECYFYGRLYFNKKRKLPCHQYSEVAYVKTLLLVLKPPFPAESLVGQI